MSPRTFIFIGRSGCGKGTQAKLLEEYLVEKYPEFPIFYLETGQGFRDFIKKGIYTSDLSAKLYEMAEPQPAFLAVWMWSHLLVENLKGSEHLIIDGTPRAHAEALVLNGAMKFYQRNYSVIYLNVSRIWSEERLKGRGRSDDVKGADIQKRLDWFDKEILPAVEYFRSSKECNFLEINGQRSIEEIHKETISQLKI